MVILRDLYESARALLNRKLGACPKCMVSSIAGSGLSWFALAILYAMWPNHLALMFGLVVAAAFTVLMITHVVVYMFRAAPIMRNLPENRQLKSRREFAFAVVRAGFSFAAAAVVSLPFLPKRVEAARNATFALYCIGTGCVVQGQGGERDVTCAGLGLPQSTLTLCVPVRGTPPATLTCTNKSCTISLSLIVGTCSASTLPRGFKCA
jgi:hypothetical protein